MVFGKIIFIALIGLCVNSLTFIVMV